MRKVLSYFALFILMLTSCNKKGQPASHLQIALKNYDLINFHSSYEDNKKYIDITVAELNLEQNTSNNWKTGYVQEVQLYVALYLSGIITKEKCLDYIGAVYQKYILSNSGYEQIKFSYAVYLYLTNKKKDSELLLNEIYHRDYVYNYTNPSNKDIKNFVSGVLLSKVKIEDFKNTFYESFYYTLDDDEYITLLQGLYS